MRRRIRILKRLSFALPLFLAAGITAEAQVTVVATAGTLGPTVYPTLDAAFVAINAGTHQGTIGVGISASTVEAGPCVLNSSGAGAAIYTAITISPTVDGVTVSGATATGRGLIELKGADNVTIDGDNPNTGGVNRNLTITNTAANTITYTSCVRICNAAAVVTSSDNIIIRNLIMNGSATGRNAAAATSTTGSENTTFGIYCGGNGGATATDAPGAITSVTTNTIPAATTVNAFQATNNEITSCARGIVFNGSAVGSSTGITVTNNVIGTAGTLTGAPPFTTPASSVYTKGIWVNGTTAVTITGNTLRNILSYVATPMNAIELAGAIGAGTISVSNNTINGLCNNASTPNAVRAILISNAGAPYTISGNSITNIQGILSGFASATTVVGIEVNTTAASATIANNMITQVYNRNPGTTAAYGINLLGGNNVAMRNNFISDLNLNMTGGFAFSPLYGVVGIRVNSGTGHAVQYNSINLYGSLLGTPFNDILTTCLAIVNTTQTGMDVRNNIFSNTMTGGTTNISHVSIFLPSGGTSVMNLNMNNNAYYCGTTAASQGIGQVGTGPNTHYLPGNFNPSVTTPATNMRSATSVLSVAGTNDNASFASTVAAPFTTASDLHINNASVNAPALDGTGTPIGGVTTDIDGNTRNATTPDIGADEFSTPVCVSSSGGTISPTTYSRCAGQTVVLTSVGATTGSGISYQWMVGTTSGGPYVNVSGGSGATTTSYTSGTLTPGTYYYVLQTTCSTGPSTGLSNEVTVTVNALPTISVTPSTSLYCNPGPAVVLTASGGVTYSWAPPTGLSGVTGSPVSASPGSSMTYTVTGTDGNGCVSTATAVVNSGPAVVNAAATATPGTLCMGDTVDLGVTANPYTVTVFSENFNTGAGTWTRINNSTGGTPANAAWTDRPDGYIYAGGPAYHSNDNSAFIQTNSDAQGSGSTTNVQMISPAFSTSGLTGMNLTFFHFYRDIGDAGDSAVVEFSTNLTSWTIAGSYVATAGSEAAFAPASVAVPVAFENQPTVYVRFRYRGTWDWYWSLDNVSIAANSSNFTYNWSSTPSGFSSSLQNPTDVPALATSYDVIITNVTGCSDTVSASVTVNPLPIVTASATASAVCMGDSVTLTGSGATSYTWTGGVTDGVAFAPATTDSYIVTGTDGNGCEAMDTISVTVNPLPPVIAAATATTVCMGDAVIFTGGGALTYTWTGGVTDGVSFVPAMTDSYIVTGLDSNGCSNMDTITVTVNALPVVTGSTTASAVCMGDSITLTGSGATSYTWSGGVTDGVGFVPAMTDSYIVTGLDSNGCMNTDTVMVTVNALPAVVANASPSAVCMGDSLTLTGSGASSYTWSSGVMDGVAFVPAITDSYIVTGLDSNGCMNMDTVTVAVNAPPTVSGSVTSPTVCMGDSVTFTGSGAVSYSWTGGVTDGAPFMPSASGSFIVTGTDSAGCMGWDTVAVTVNALPVVTLSLPITTICVDDGAYTLTGGSPSGGTWSGTGVSGTTFTPATAGVGTVNITYSYTDGNGCSNTSTDNLIVDACIGINNPNAAGQAVNIYPNPNTGLFTISLGAMPAVPVKVDIHNGLGQVIDSFMMTTETRQVDLHALECGIYFVRMTTGNTTSTYRVVRQ